MITVSALTKKYGDRTVVDRVSFELEPGTVTGFLGPNGAGKTTTMRMITGLVPASAGQARVGGTPYASLPSPGAVMGTLLDAGAVHPGRTGRTHLRILAGTLGVATGRVDEVLEMVGLTAAAGRRDQPGDHPHRGGLAGPVRSQEPGHRAGLQLEGHLVDDGPVAVLLGQSADLDHLCLL